MTTTAIITQEILWRFAASEPATSYTFTSARASKSSGGIAAYTDVANQANPINAANGQANNTSSVTATAPQITTTVANTRLLTLVGSSTGNGGDDELDGPQRQRALGPLLDDHPQLVVTRLGDEAFVGPGLTPARSGTNVAAAAASGSRSRSPRSPPTARAR